MARAKAWTRNKKDNNLLHKNCYVQTTKSDQKKGNTTQSTNCTGAPSLFYDIDKCLSG